MQALQLAAELISEVNASRVFCGVVAGSTMLAVAMIAAA